jgi:hypothetical protein|tara:strand:- start:87 stop:359 length:273 start_codon:yes stop_codon:yes gene_type:complete
MPAQGSQDWITDYPKGHRHQQMIMVFSRFLPEQRHIYNSWINAPAILPFLLSESLCVLVISSYSFVKDMYMTHTEQGTFFGMTMTASVDF